jgi:hypothetical protein
MMSTTSSSRGNSAFPLPTPLKCAYQAAEKSFSSNKSPHISLLSSEGLYAPSSYPLPSGASFLLEIHRRRKKSATPFQNMTRKEREYVDKSTAPLQKITGKEQSLLRKSATPLQRLTKKERNLLLEKAVNLSTEDF